MLDVLDHEYARISAELGCRAEERITVIVQSREAYLQSSGAAEWSGAQFDGRIRVALVAGEQRVGPQTRRTFAHELTHACLSALGSWPSWFHEGMAQRLSGDRLNQREIERLNQLTQAHALPPLEALSRNWSGLSSQNAAAAYALSLRAADLIVEHYAAYGLRNIMGNPAKFAEITKEIDRKLGLI
jgi:hypothetical protein